jgi:ribosomal protein S18 acetylase RimI-like enzyme
MTSGPKQIRPDRPWLVTSGQQDPDTVDRLLRSLPDWFGIESANAHYVTKAHDLPTYLAWPTPSSPVPGKSGHPTGVLLLARHFPESAEIYLMAVEPALHRQGIGRAMAEALEADLLAEGVDLLQVKTLGPSRPDANYERTRRFYTRMGFRPLEEIPDLWPGNPCLIMVKALQPLARSAK